jgi:hypothetical protein
MKKVPLPFVALEKTKGEGASLTPSPTALEDFVSTLERQCLG